MTNPGARAPRHRPALPGARGATRATPGATCRRWARPARSLSFVPPRAAGTRCRRWWSRRASRFGLFRAWTRVASGRAVLAYPQPEQPAPPLPPAQSAPGGAPQAARRARAASSTACAPTGAATRCARWCGRRRRAAGAAGQPRHQRRAQPRAVARLAGHAGRRPAGAEGRLSRLAAWVLAAERQGLRLRPAPARPADRARPRRRAPARACCRSAGAVALSAVRRRPGCRAPGPAGATCRATARDTLFLLAVIGWTVLPHLAHLPPWCVALTALVLFWRAHLALTNARAAGPLGAGRRAAARRRR